MLRVFSSVVFLFFMGSCVLGQGMNQTAGGNVQGMSYVIGQVVYGASLGGEVTQGVIDFLEVTVLSGKSYKEIELKVFPNPTPTVLSLEVSSLENVYTRVYNTEGKIMEEGRVQNGIGEFDMERYSSGVYLLKVYAEKKEIKTFKIVKL